jgi:acyl carrier protein
MKKKDIFAEVKDMLVDQLGINPDEIELESELETMGLDSLDNLEGIMSMEEVFGIEIDDEDAAKWRTVQDAVDFIRARIA